MIIYNRNQACFVVLFLLNWHFETQANSKIQINMYMCIMKYYLLKLLEFIFHLLNEKNTLRSEIFTYMMNFA